MVQIEDIAAAVLEHDSLRARSLLQDFLRRDVDLSSYPRPTGLDQRILTMTAALLSLFAERQGTSAPAWVEDAGVFTEEFFVSKRAMTQESVREACRRDSPEPLRRRNIYAPAAFMTSA